MTKEISPVYAYGLIAIVGIICALMVFNTSKAYYADKIAMYNSQALAAQLQLKVLQLAHKGQIGTAAFIKAK